MTKAGNWQKQVLRPRQKMSALCSAPYVGEADYLSLLLARRQATAASLQCLEAKVESARLITALIDAHSVWGSDH